MSFLEHMYVFLLRKKLPPSIGEEDNFLYLSSQVLAGLRIQLT